VDLLTIKTFDHSVDAYLYKAKLEHEGILCFLFDENMSSIYTSLVGGIKLKIKEQDWEKAKSVLLEMGDELIRICPQCFSINVQAKSDEQKNWKDFFKELSLKKVNAWKCLDCTQEFE